MTRRTAITFICYTHLSSQTCQNNILQELDSKTGHRLYAASARSIDYYLFIYFFIYGFTCVLSGYLSVRLWHMPSSIDFFKSRSDQTDLIVTATIQYTYNVIYIYSNTYRMYYYIIRIRRFKIGNSVRVHVLEGGG